MGQEAHGTKREGYAPLGGVATSGRSGGWQGNIACLVAPEGVGLDSCPIRFAEPFRTS